MNTYNPARDVTPAFLHRVTDWLATAGEVLVHLRYLHGAGSRDFAVCRTIEQFGAIVDAVPIGTDIEVCRAPFLPLRGVVNDQLSAAILAAVPDGHDYLVLSTRTEPAVPVAATWDWDNRHECLAEWLADHAGEEIAAGPSPDWIAPDNDDMVSAAKGGIDGPR